MPRLLRPTVLLSDAAIRRVDRTACLREAAAAQDAKQRGKLNSPGGYDENALKRCNRQPEGAARDACVKRVTGAGTTHVTGSVKGGGKLRTTEMPVPASTPSSETIKQKENAMKIIAGPRLTKGS